MKTIIMEKIRNLMNNFKSPLLEFFHLLIGFSILGGLFYLRFLPRIARDLYQNMSSLRIFIILCILACVIFNIYRTLKTMGLIKTKEPTGIIKKFKDLLDKFLSYISFTLQNAYQFIWYIIKKIGIKIFKKEHLHFYTIRKLAAFCCIVPEISELCFIVLYWIKFGPRILFIFTFFIEVFFFQHLDYTFTFIPLLLIIYLEPIFLYILTHFYDTYYEGVISFLDFDYYSKPDDIVITYKPGAEEFGIPYEAKNLDEYVDNLCILHRITVFMQAYEYWNEDVLVQHKLLILQIIRLAIYVFILYYGIK